MNLITDAWIPVRTQSGVFKLISPLDLTDPIDPAQALDAVRPDFNGALAQFLIGLLYTLMPPKDDYVWEELLLNPPTRTALETALLKSKASFELLSDTGLAFMQDFSPTLDDGGSVCALEALLIEAPGVNTVENNAAHFIKARTGLAVCGASAAQMLLTLQINAPSGGAGHRTGLRGGGPLTTLIWPQRRSDSKTPTTLFEKLWCNVRKPYERHNLSSAFPWCAPTLISDGKPPRQAMGNDLWEFWATPRRIRLIPSASDGICELDPRLPPGPRISGYSTRNYGANYPSDKYIHSLSPYYYVKKDDSWLPLHPKSGGFGYREWPTFAAAPSDGNMGEADARKMAKVFELSADRRSTMRQHFAAQPDMWVFGFEMDNMKALAWHEALMPTLLDLPPAAALQVGSLAALLVRAADVAASQLAQAVRKSLSESAKSDSGPLRTQFYDATEAAFYRHIFAAQPEQSTTDIQHSWRKELWFRVFEMFEAFTQITAPEQDGRLARAERTSKAEGDLRRYLGKALNEALDLRTEPGSKAGKSTKSKPKQEAA